MAVAIPTLALIVLAFAIPNYVAVRYAMFGGSPEVPVTGGAMRRPATAPWKRWFAVFIRRGYLWKALSPSVFAVSIIMGLGLGGAVGAGLVVLGALNLVYGLLGWDSYKPLQK